MDETQPALRVLDHAELLLRVDEWHHDQTRYGDGSWYELPLPEIRDAEASGDGSWIIDGYAAVFDTETTLVDVPGLRIRERIDAGAFTSALDDPALLVHLNHGHDMTKAIAASDVTGVGGLRLRQDATGLGYSARVDPQDPDARSLAVKMRRGVVKGASFRFMIGDETRTETTTDDMTDVLYRIHDIPWLGDVCACAQGAYRQATSNIRSLDDLGLRRRSGQAPEGTPRRSEPLGVTPVAAQRGGSEPEQAELEAMRMRLGLAASSLRQKEG